LPLRPIIPSPQLHISLLPSWVRGSVQRWWLAFPLVGFAPTGEYEFISALLRKSVLICVLKITGKWNSAR
ncbi:MAG: hypothetical protein K8R06_00730, partial [Methanosarcinales archaeon]|nr:hypothetical protein [Methanosarcinales archaeon]